jgi:hypothetical protein
MGAAAREHASRFFVQNYVDRVEALLLGADQGRTATHAPTGGGS